MVVPPLGQARLADRPKGCVPPVPPPPLHILPLHPALGRGREPLVGIPTPNGRGDNPGILPGEDLGLGRARPRRESQGRDGRGVLFSEQQRPVVVRPTGGSQPDRGRGPSPPSDAFDPGPFDEPIRDVDPGRSSSGARTGHTPAVPLPVLAPPRPPGPLPRLAPCDPAAPGTVQCDGPLPHPPGPAPRPPR